MDISKAASEMAKRSNLNITEAQKDARRKNLMLARAARTIAAGARKKAAKAEAKNNLAPIENIS